VAGPVGAPRGRPWLSPRSWSAEARVDRGGVAHGGARASMTRQPNDGGSGRSCSLRRPDSECIPPARPGRHPGLRGAGGWGEVAWEEKLARQVAYKETHGDCNVPYS
jgi:hypothetical protein